MPSLSAAGIPASRISSEKGNFDELTMKFCLKIGHKRTTRKTRKTPKASEIDNKREEHYREENPRFLPPLLNAVTMKVKEYGMMF